MVSDVHAVFYATTAKGKGQKLQKPDLSDPKATPVEVWI
jgi:hypothetical protein